MDKLDIFGLTPQKGDDVNDCIDQLSMQGDDTVGALQKLWAYIANSRSANSTALYVTKRLLRSMDNARREIFFRSILSILEKPENVPCFVDPRVKIFACWILELASNVTKDGYASRAASGHWPKSVEVQMRENASAIQKAIGRVTFTKEPGA
jgi:hypothetical protein